MSHVFDRLRRHRALRYPGRVLGVLAVILAVVFVTTLTVDLGPAARRYAEEQGSKALNRPIHLGGLKIRLLGGRFEVDDFRIDGLHPGDRPFFTAGHLSATLDWSTAFTWPAEITIATVEMTDWQMLVEKWQDGHNFPKFTSDDDKPKGPKRFVTTMKWLRAYRGQFAYEDHEAPFDIVARNLDINIGNLPQYHGTAVFTGGTVTIQDHLPMWTNMKASFVVDGNRLHLDRIDLDSDGAKSTAVGDVDLAHWPEMTYQVTSRVHFPRMREVFFTKEPWRVTGDGDFSGVFHLFKGGHELTGKFTSAVTSVNDYLFPALFGSLRWTNHGFEVWDAGSRFSGGDARFTYSIKPLGEPTRPTSRFDTTLTGVDVAALSDFERFAGLRFAGSASAHNVLEWPLGRFAEARAEGHLVVTPPPGVEAMAPALATTTSAAGRPADPDLTLREWGPYAPVPIPTHLPVAADVTYRFDPEGIEVAPSRFASDRTYVAFQGATAWGSRSRFTFHVTSRDLQESDQLLVGFLRDFGSRARPVAFGGRGVFDGVMTGAFRRPRVEGRFAGDELRAWDTFWGSGGADLVIENDYITIKDGVVRSGGSEIRTDGLFSLGYPREDGGEELNARFRVVGRDLDGLRHAFHLDDYPMSGRLTGEFHLTGDYERPLGFGGMTIDRGAAYREPFDKATASLRFDGSGVRLDGITVTKGPGSMSGAAYVGWDSTYSFNFDGRRIPVEQIAAFQYPGAAVSGIGEFTAAGNGTFDQPRYDVRFRMNDLFVAQEAVGQIAGTLALRGREVSGEVQAASSRLAITGTGRISLTPSADAEMTFRVHDSSLDPYLRLFVPQLAPSTTLVASGSIRVVGALTDPDHLLVDGTVDTLEMRLFDYTLKNATPVRLAVDQRRVSIEDLDLVGEGTSLRVSGTVGLNDERIALKAAGEANLGVLQGFFRDVRASGHAELSAAVDGPLRAPLFSGRATISDGRIRHFSLPNALDAINGVVQFDARGVRLDEVSATMGGGQVQFGGRIGFEGYLPGELNVTVRGSDMRLRYPEGVRSVVDADLVVRGNAKAPTLGGTVTVKDAVWSRRIDTSGGLFDFSGRSTGADLAAAAAPPAFPLRFDLQVLIPSTLRVESNLVDNMVANADLQLRGTYDRPILYGRAEIERGEVKFEGRRYRVTRGNIDFTNPARIEPFFDVEAETNVRVPGQTYRVIVSFAGTTERLQPQLSADPPLAATDVLALLFSDVRRNGQGPGDVELRALQNPNQRQTDILTARATQILANPISSEVGKVMEQTFGVDTFQLTPSLFDPYSQSTTTRVNPSARVTIGKRISDRVYLTFSRSLSTSINDQIILLEYDGSERLSWILSRNEDQTYALEFRVRHTF